MQEHQNVVLTNMEEMSNIAGLVLGHVWQNTKGFELKSIQKEFDAIGLSDLIAHDDSLALDNG
jgi:hypothetical protein